MLYFIVMLVFIFILVVLLSSPYTFYGMVTGISLNWISTINLQSVLLILLLAVPMFLVSGMAENLKYAFICMVKKSMSYSKKELSNALEAVCLAKKLLFSAGIMASLILFVVGLHQLDDVAYLGPMVAGLVYPVFFSLFFLLIFYPIEAKLKKLINNLE